MKKLASNIDKSIYCDRSDRYNIVRLREILDIVNNSQTRIPHLSMLIEAIQKPTNIMLLLDSLIDDAEKWKNITPYLQLHFLLVENFFISENQKIKTIKRAIQFFNDFNSGYSTTTRNYVNHVLVSFLNKKTFTCSAELDEICFESIKYILNCIFSSQFRPSFSLGLSIIRALLSSIAPIPANKAKVKDIFSQHLQASIELLHSLLYAEVSYEIVVEMIKNIKDNKQRLSTYIDIMGYFACSFCSSACRELLLMLPEMLHLEKQFMLEGELDDVVLHSRLGSIMNMTCREEIIYNHILDILEAWKNYPNVELITAITQRILHFSPELILNIIDWFAGQSVDFVIDSNFFNVLVSGLGVMTSPGQGKKQEVVDIMIFLARKKQFIKKIMLSNNNNIEYSNYDLAVLLALAVVVDGQGFCENIIAQIPDNIKKTIDAYVIAEVYTMLILYYGKLKSGKEKIDITNNAVFMAVRNTFARLLGQEIEAQAYELLKYKI